MSAIYFVREHSDWSIWIKKPQEIVNILTNFSKFEEVREELIRRTAKLEQMNWSNIFGILLLPRLYILVFTYNVRLGHEKFSRKFNISCGYGECAEKTTAFFKEK